MKKMLLFSAALAVSLVCFAKNVVPIHTSCGKIAYIDADRQSVEDTIKQVIAIDETLCPDKDVK